MMYLIKCDLEEQATQFQNLSFPFNALPPPPNQPSFRQQLNVFYLSALSTNSTRLLPSTFYCDHQILN